jgi:ribosomal protein L37AE/L43A
MVNMIETTTNVSHEFEHCPDCQTPCMFSDLRGYYQCPKCYEIWKKDRKKCYELLKKERKK